MHDKLDFNPVRVLQPDNGFKDFPPLLVAGKVIIREKIECNTRLLIILLDCLRDRFWVTHAHLASLHINNRAEAATKGTTTSTINGPKLLVGEAPQIFFMNHGDWRRA